MRSALRSSLLMLLLLAPDPVEAQTPIAVANTGATLMVAGNVDSALAFWTSHWTAPEDRAKVVQLASSFRQIPMHVGPLTGFDHIRTVELTPNLQRIYLLLRGETAPIYLQLVLYRPREKWVVATVNWHTHPDQVLPPDMFGPQSPGRP
jgi:hypothetical protein